MNNNRIQQIIRECIYKAINEGTTYDDTIQKWELLKEQLGCEQMVSEIFNYLSSDQLEQLVEWFNQDYDLWYNNEDF